MIIYDYILLYMIIYLLGGFNHVEKYESMGRIIPYIMENKKNVPNHQPGYIINGKWLGNDYGIS